PTANTPFPYTTLFRARGRGGRLLFPECAFRRPADGHARAFAVCGAAHAADRPADGGPPRFSAGGGAVLPVLPRDGRAANPYGVAPDGGRREAPRGNPGGV